MRKSVYQDLVDRGVKAERARFFVDFSLPMWRKPRPAGGRKWPHIEIGGDCLRIGKTTTKQVLAEQIGGRGWPFVFSDEDWKSNPYLKESYQGKADSLLESQKWFAARKKAQLETVSDSSFWIQVVHPEMDFGYAMTNYLLEKLTKLQWQDYWRHYQSLRWEAVPAPDLLVYITGSPVTLIQRFNTTARDFEKADEAYIRVMQLVNQRWLELAKKQWPVLVVKTDNFDYSYLSGTDENQVRLGNMVIDRLNGLGWEL